MKPYEELVKECNELIPEEVISQRDGGFGKQLNYLEGWYVIDRLNKVFGPGNWAYTSEVSLLHHGTVETRSGPSHSSHYSARVRLVVTIGDKPTEFTDYGYGDGTDKSNPGKSHELAIKEAVTDGLKRAARCLGNSFGNGLYDRSGAGIAKEEAPKPQPPVASQGKSQKPVPSAAPKTKRETLNRLISQTAKVVMDMKKRSFEDVEGLILAYGVTKKEELTDAQAQAVLAELEGVLK